MDDKRPDEIVIVRRRRDPFGDEPKTGVWKIAYADFMTAMMAFFLVMWLINATDQETREIVATYFNPIKLAEATTDRKGLRDPDSSSSGSTSEERSEEPPPRGGEGASSQGAAPGDAPRYSEAALFQDPYAVLAEIAAELDARAALPSAAIDLSPGAAGDPGLSGGDAFRDPFDPVYWQVAPQLRVGRSDGDGTGGPVGVTDAGAAFPELGPGGGPTGAERAAIPFPPGVAAELAVAEPEAEPGNAAENDAGENEAGESEARALAGEIRERVAREFPAAAARPALEVRATSEGVLISLTDEAQFGMFAIGSAEPAPEVVGFLQSVGRVLSDRPGRIVIRGHTDARPFRSADYDNWRLSTARAHMASYMLLRGGLEEGRIARVEGHADRMLKTPVEPEAAENRRIEILLMEGPA
ncbi:MAG: MotB family protein [Microvirga sp.]|nr:MotB family protein [Microvirga sp.]